jgi:hypothetical protein
MVLLEWTLSCYLQYSNTWTVDIYSGHHLEDFEVSLLGNRRRIGTRVIPEAYVCNFTFRSLTVEPANFVEEICDNRDAFGDFDRYSANQAKEELGFQKGKYQKERTLNQRSNLARAIRSGEALPNVGPPLEASNPIIGTGTIDFVGPPVSIPDETGAAPILPINATFSGKIPANPDDRTPAQQILAEESPSSVEGVFDSTVSGIERDHINKKKQEIRTSSSGRPGLEPIFDTRSSSDSDLGFDLGLTPQYNPANPL